MKIAIVTGCAGKIGHQITVALKKHGFCVYGIDVNEVVDGSIFAHFEIGDITNFENLQKLLHKAVSESHDISLVNNAGITLEISELNFLQYWKKTVDVNLTAPFMFMELFKQNVESGAIKYGSIVNIGSLAAHRGFGDNPAYVASKTGLIGLTRAFADCLGPHGVRVNSISPGYIKSSMTQKSQDNAQRAETIRNLSMLKSWGEPNAVASTVVFLLSEAAGFITGSDIAVDGGWLNKGSFN